MYNIVAQPISINLFCHRERELIFSSWNSIVSNLEVIKNLSLKLEFEINIILDDADIETYKVLEDLREFEFNLYEVNTNDLGKNRNIAVDKSKYDLVAFLDADDIWEKIG